MNKGLKSGRRELSEIAKIESVDALNLAARRAVQEQRVINSGATPSPGANGIQRAQVITMLKGDCPEVGQDIFMHDPRRLIGLNASKRNIRYQPLAFTEHGVAMLSAVLHSDRAVQMSIAIIRTFVRLRQLIENSKDIAARVEKLERGHDRSASVIEILVEDIDRLAREVKDMKALPPVTKRKIGFRLGDDD